MQLIQEAVAPPFSHITLMRVEGPLVRSSAAPLREFVEGQPSRHLLLDLTDVAPIKPETISELIYASSQILAAGGQLELLDHSGNFNLAMRGTDFEKIFRAHDGLQVALKSFDTVESRRQPVTVSLLHYLRPGY